MIAFFTFSRLKPYLPQSIFTRFLLIIMVPALLAQTIAVYIFYERHWSNVSERLDAILASEIAWTVDSMEHTPHPYLPNSPLERSKLFLNFDISFFPNAHLPDIRLTSLDNYKGFSDILRSTITLPYHLYHTNHNRNIVVDIAVNQGVLHIITTRKRLATPTTYIFILWMTGTTFLFLMISLIFMRNQIRPIIRLARAADKFGKGKVISPLKLEGASEIRKATAAFLAMKTRIDRLVSQRTDMLAGVSHDLRTPITRMKLQLALIPPSSTTQELMQDITEMERMIQAYLDFAKSGTSSTTEVVNLSEFLTTITASYSDSTLRITLGIPNGLTLTINPDYLKRIICNLVDNALRYGKQVIISGHATTSQIILAIDDDGPGIPQEQHEAVFRPFYRLENSRNPETGGVGLGLAIVRDLTSRCGGHITLGQSPNGGLRVTLSFPI